jgi:hypothetical protein
MGLAELTSKIQFTDLRAGRDGLIAIEYRGVSPSDRFEELARECRRCESPSHPTRDFDIAEPLVDKRGYQRCICLSFSHESNGPRHVLPYR